MSTMLPRRMVAPLAKRSPWMWMSLAAWLLPWLGWIRWMAGKTSGVGVAVGVFVPVAVAVAVEV
ncbi:MAG: hypothetical protein KJZ93_26080 [Caldilineaceae bacterium]|nr:hypothetical protein [Caldilineaceae bacterium]